MTARATSDVEDGPHRPVEQALVLVGGPSEPAPPVTGTTPPRSSRRLNGRDSTVVSITVSVNRSSP